MFNAHMGFDVSLHDTFFVIGHFHVMLAGAATSGIFSAFYFYFSSIFGVAYTRSLALTHFVLYFFGQLLTVIPMIWLGWSGMPRRLMDYPAYFGGWHSVITGGHMISTLGMVFFFAMVVHSLCVGNCGLTKSLGVPRLNTRLAFYAYERRRLGLASASNLSLQRPYTGP